MADKFDPGLPDEVSEAEPVCCECKTPFFWNDYAERDTAPSERLCDPCAQDIATKSRTAISEAYAIGKRDGAKEELVNLKMFARGSNGTYPLWDYVGSRLAELEKEETGK